MGIRLVRDLRGVVGDIAEWTAKCAERGIGAALGSDSRHCVANDPSASATRGVECDRDEVVGKGDDAI